MKNHARRRSCYAVRALIVFFSLMSTGFVGASAAPAAAPSARIVLVDDTGAQITLAGPARRIVSLSAGATELLVAAGAGDRIVATVTGAVRHGVRCRSTTAVIPNVVRDPGATSGSRETAKNPVSLGGLGMTSMS